MNDKPDEPANPSGSEPSDSSAPARNDQPEGLQALAQAVAELKAANADLRDKHLRTIAEMENFRRRAEKEKADGMKYAVTDFARDIVSIGDNLRRAIEAVQKEPVDENPALKTLLDGVQVTERELIKIFERHGITRFDPLHERFDPHSQEAMIKVDVPGVPADTVVQVLQAGYKLNDRVLRPAAVIVAKGGPAVQERKAQAAVADSAGGSAQPDGPAGAENADGERAVTQPGAAQEHDPDIVRDATGAPRGGQARRERPAQEKRTSSVTQPVTDGSGTVNKDDLISSFGKRLENGG